MADLQRLTMAELEARVTNAQAARDAAGRAVTRLEREVAEARRELGRRRDAAKPPYCHASRGDGECWWSECPQQANWRPVCPLWVRDEEDY